MIIPATSTRHSLGNAFHKNHQIKNTSGLCIEAFVSAYNKHGNDGWYLVPNSFTDCADSTWKRGGWEVVVFRNKNNHDQTAARYLNLCNRTLISFHSFNNIDVVTLE